MSRDPYLDHDAHYWALLLESPDPIDRRLGVYALGELGARASHMTGRLLASLEDAVPFVRVWAAAAVARISSDRPEALLTLVEATEDEVPFVRSLAAWHLGRLGSRCPDIGSGLPALERLLDDEDPSVRHEAALALERLHPDADVVLKNRSPVLRPPDRHPR